MKKRTFFFCIAILMITLSGCAHKILTDIYFESYNELEDTQESIYERYGFVFSAYGRRYKILTGDDAEHLKYTDEDKQNQYKIMIANEAKEIIFSLDTDSEYSINGIRECTDSDGKIYVMYSKYDASFSSMYIDELKSTYVLEMFIDKNTVNIKKQYYFGPAIVVITIRNGYIYTMEDGRIYRKMLDGTGKKECMADLGFRGMPDPQIITELYFQTGTSGIEVNANYLINKEEYTIINKVIADVGYKDQPIEIIE